LTFTGSQNYPEFTRIYNKGTCTATSDCTYELGIWNDGGTIDIHANLTITGKVAVAFGYSSQGSLLQTSGLLRIDGGRQLEVSAGLWVLGGSMGIVQSGVAFEETTVKGDMLLDGHDTRLGWFYRAPPLPSVYSGVLDVTGNVQWNGGAFRVKLDAYISDSGT